MGNVANGDVEALRKLGLRPPAFVPQFRDAQPQIREDALRLLHPRNVRRVDPKKNE
jgi:hypothetical protein